MSFFKDIYNDFTRFEPEINTEAVQKQAKGILFGSIGLLVMFLLFSIISSINRTIPLNVHIYSKDFASQEGYNTVYGTFGHGREGILNYVPANFIDAILFSSFGNLNLMDFLFFLYIGILMFKTLRKINEEETFRLQCSNTFMKIAAGCFWMYPLKMLYDGILIETLFSYRTNHEFAVLSPTHQSFSYIIYIIFGGIILTFVHFMNKGVELQQEKDLTI